jgi:hypothetical protein
VAAISIRTARIQRIELGLFTNLCNMGKPDRVGCKVATGKVGGELAGIVAHEGATKNRNMVEVKQSVRSKSSKGRSLKSDYG